MSSFIRLNFSSCLAGIILCTCVPVCAFDVALDGFDTSQSLTITTPTASGQTGPAAVTGAVSDQRLLAIQANDILHGNKTNTISASGGILTMSQGPSSPGAHYTVTWQGSDWNTTPYNLGSALSSFDFASYTFNINVTTLSNATPSLQVRLNSGAGSATYTGIASTASTVSLTHASTSGSFDPSQITSISFVATLAKSTGGGRVLGIGDMAAVPEPSETALVLGVAMGLLVLIRRHRRSVGA